MQFKFTLWQALAHGSVTLLVFICNSLKPSETVFSIAGKYTKISQALLRVLLWNVCCVNSVMAFHNGIEFKSFIFSMGKV